MQSLNWSFIIKIKQLNSYLTTVRLVNMRYLIAVIIILLAKGVYADNKWVDATSFNTKEVYVKKGMITTIQFSSIINYFVVGDELIADAENITSNTLLISPKLAGERTNINVSTKDGNFVFMVNTLDYTDKTEPNLHISVGKLAFTNQEKLAKKVEK